MNWIITPVIIIIIIIKIIITIIIIIIMIVLPREHGHLFQYRGYADNLLCAVTAKRPRRDFQEKNLATDEERAWLYQLSVFVILLIGTLYITQRTGAVAGEETI